MDPEAIPDFLANSRDSAPEELQHYFLSFEDYWERKLWHELTDLLLQYFREPASAPQRLSIYNDFVKGFADKINQLKLVEIGLIASMQCEDDSVRLKFLTTLSTRVNKPANQDAYVYALSAVATNQIALEAYPAARKDLDTCERILDTFDRVEPSVHAAFYRTLSRYHQTQSDFTAYYRTTLLYLACVELDDLSLEYKQSIAYDLSLAALVSETLYNFGELLLHPILSTLQSTPHAWLRDLLFAFNRGDLNAYHSLLAANSTRLPPILRQHSTALHQKISLAALTQLVFSRPPSDRAMTFTTISEETKVALDEIEHLIMKALSLGLVRGVIDQVEGVARISWVQPKVLEKDGVEGLRGRLEEWSAGVERLGGWVEGVGVGVWSA